MSIDEVIKTCKDITNYEENCPGYCMSRTCDKCVQESEQLAEWLEELKTYRKYIDLTKIPEQYKLGFQDGIIEGNNKAIDDFANVLKENYDYLPQILSQEAFGLYIDEYAERLKEGVKE